jgi:hypothetical protein
MRSHQERVPAPLAVEWSRMRSGCAMLLAASRIRLLGIRREASQRLTNYSSVFTPYIRKLFSTV